MGFLEEGTMTTIVEKRNADLRGETFLSTSASRLALAALFGAGTLSAALPAHAIDVANEAQLRDAITGGQSTITFTANITLTANLPQVQSSAIINGGNFTLSGNNQFRGLVVQSGTVAVNDLTIANATAQGGNGGSGGTGGGGGGGLGGALYVASGANVTVSNVTLQDNAARGGNGGPGGQAIAGGGGGGMSGNGSPAVNTTPGSGGAGNGGRGGGSVGPGDPGGFGGGGGGAGIFDPNLGGNGGFGGGGGGGRSFSGGSGGFGGGDGSSSNTSAAGRGGGGAGLGGAIFVQQGGNLTMNGGLNVLNNTVAGGAAGGPGAQAGRGAGSGLFLQGSGLFTVAPGAGQTQTISDTIADQNGIAGSGGSWTLVKNGAGTTVLTGDNAYSGGANVIDGTLQGNSASLKGNIANGAAVVFEQTSNGTYAGNMSGSGTLTKTGTGILTLTGTNTYSGGTTLSAGTLQGNATSLQGNITNNASVVFNQAGSGTYAGIMSGAGTFTKTGAGILTLTGNNTYSGGTTVGEGTLQGTTLSLQGNITNNAAVALDQAGNGTYSGNMSGNGALFKRGAGELELTGTNTYTGGTQVAGGTLRVASDDKLGAAGGHLQLQDNGTLRASETFTSARAVGLLGRTGGGFQIDAGKVLTLSGIVSGEGSLTKGGDGTLTLTGDNAKFEGDIRINAGTVQGNGANLTQRGNIIFDSTPGNPSSRSVVFDIPEHFGSDSFRGNIEGAGSVTKTGAARLDLLGNNSYTGGTAVLAGELRGTTRSLQGTITNNATLIFDQSFDGTYAGAMTGSGALIKNGSGKLTLTGISSVGGGTTINAGGFAVNNHLTSNVTLNKGGVLSGVGNITGDITNNGGTIEPGNSIGNLTINGNLTWNSGTFDVEVNPSGASDRITIVGAGHKVTVHAGTLQVIPQPGAYVPNTKYTILTAPAGGIATFNDITGGVGFLTPALSFDDTNLYLSLVLAPNAFRSAGQTVNQQAVGGALDAIAASGNVGGIVTTMANVSTAQGAPALQALSSEPYADFGTVNIRSSQLFSNAVGRQMAVERGATVGPKGVALAEACEVSCDETAPPRLSAWLSGIGSTGSVLGDSNAAGLTYTLGGTAFGIDYRLDPRFLVGIAGGYVGGSQWVNGFGGNGYTDSLSVALYGSFTQNASGGGFYADALAGYANSNNRLQRVVAFPGLSPAVANGQTSANQFLGQVETGYKFGLPFPANTSISPFGRLQIGTANQAAFTESGTSPFNLSVASQTTTSVRTTLGADFAASFDMGGGRPLDIGVRLGWMHEFADTARPITAAFAAAPVSQFTVLGATPQRDSAVVGFSAAAAITDRASLFASYDGEMGGGTDNHALRVGFRLTW
ncbi:MAG: autotransporter domain-containing protein [Rhodospirillales bacterium]|nr:autotransporter domain-containing protein [Rhodospirillales bacterium]